MNNSRDRRLMPPSQLRQVCRHLEEINKQQSEELKRKDAIIEAQRVEIEKRKEQAKKKPNSKYLEKLAKQHRKFSP